MRKVSLFEHLTLDGVMQAPGRADEDRRDDFPHGGWWAPYNDQVLGEIVAEGLATDVDLLFGRRTYEDFAGFWPKQEDNPFTSVLNARRKYVASRTLKEPLPWANSTLLEGDAADAVAKLKQEPGKDIVILGSGGLVRSLMKRGLVDELTLAIAPLLLGSGGRLFGGDGAHAALRLVDARPTTTGVIVATYATS
jgi:dihydrofolate reductase